jgi:hypothetical protein
MTHGEENKLYGRDRDYETHLLWEPFTADKCTSLGGKPKLFFIQVWLLKISIQIYKDTDSLGSRRRRALILRSFEKYGYKLKGT